MTPKVRSAVSAFIVAAAAVAVASLVAWAATVFAGINRIGVLFLAAVVVAAACRGRGSGLAAALLGVIAYDFIHRPVAMLTFSADDGINLTIFLAIALLVGNLAGALREQASRASLQSRRLQLLFDTSRAMTAAATERAIWDRLCDGLSPVSRRAALLDAEGKVCWSLGDPLPESVRSSAHAAFAGPDAVRPGRFDEWRAFPMKNGAEHLGLLLWHGDSVKDTAEDLVAVLVDVAAASVARARLAEESSRLRENVQQERFREVLLSAVSHDFRSPLSAIIGSVTSLLEYGDRFDPAISRDLLLNIKEEGERLDQFVANLLSWSRLKAGSLQLRLGPVELPELAERVVRRLVGTPYGTRCEVDVEGHPVACADPMLLEQALFNLVDNALRYSSADAAVVVRVADDDGGGCRIDVIDEGSGMAEPKLAGVPDAPSTEAHGAGLGLSIARGLVEAQHGRLELSSRADGRPGLQATLSIPAHD